MMSSKSVRIFLTIAALTASAHAGAFQKPLEFRPLIIGGSEVSPRDPIAQTTVALLAGNSICTGSIVEEDLIVTAAHCVGSAVSQMKVVFSTNATAAEPTGSTASVIGKEIPREYDDAALGRDQHDIALIRIDGAIPDGYRVAQLLRDDSVLRDGKTVTLAGFGISNAHSHEGAGTLRKTKVKISDAAFARTEVLVDQTGGTGACHGDSGGPAFVQEGGSLALWGVTNRAHPNEAPDDCAHQAVYTNILAHGSWLAEAAKRLRN